MTYHNPTPTVDIIIEMIDRPHRPVILIERQNPPHGWAFPGGFLDYGEAAETAAIREAAEEVSLEIKLVEQFQVYSDPQRDPRQHTLSIVFIAMATGNPQAADDAKNIRLCNPWEKPDRLCFDHEKIWQDYWNYRHYGLRPKFL